MGNIIITGASRGIGYQLAKGFSQNKSNNVLAISRNKENLNQLQKEVSEFGGVITCFPADLTKENEQNEIIAWVKNHFQGVDILINNAGSLLNKPFSEITAEETMQQFNINFIAPTQLTRKIFPFLKKASSPHVVNIGSMGGVQGSAKFPGLSIYSASKGALAIFSECLAEEWKGHNIKINCLALGAVQTEMLKEAFPGYEAPLSAKQMAEYIIIYATTAGEVMNGQVVPVTLSNP